jgi:hypothetical protein
VPDGGPAYVLPDLARRDGSRLSITAKLGVKRGKPAWCSARSRSGPP